MMRNYLFILICLIPFLPAKSQEIEAGTFSILGQEEQTDPAIQITGVAGIPFASTNGSDNFSYGLMEIAESNAETIFIQGIEIGDTELTLQTDDTYQLSVTIEGTTESNEAVSWTSTNPSIATISSDGLLTTISTGETTITATTAGGNFSAQCTVIVEAKVPTGNTTIDPENILYPTIVENEFTVSVSQQEQLYIFNTNGKLIQKEFIPIGQTTLRFNQPKGIYFVKVGKKVIKIVKK